MPSTTVESAPDGLPVLHILCPRQMRGQAILLGVCGLAVIGTGLARQLAGPSASVSWFFVVVALAMGLLQAAVLYRNLVFRDAACFYRNAHAPGNCMLALAADSVRSVRAIGAPDASSPAGKMAWLGFGPGRIEIDTATHRYRFGVGLDEAAVDHTVARIAAYCGIHSDQVRMSGAMPKP